MNETTLSSFVLILAVVALAPVLADVVERWVRVPSVVIEILAGVLIGPALGWAEVDDVIEFLSQLGPGAADVPGRAGDRPRPRAGPAAAAGHDRLARLARHRDRASASR